MYRLLDFTMEPPKLPQRAFHGWIIEREWTSCTGSSNSHWHYLNLRRRLAAPLRYSQLQGSYQNDMQMIAARRYATFEKELSSVRLIEQMSSIFS